MWPHDFDFDYSDNKQCDDFMHQYNHYNPYNPYSKSQSDSFVTGTDHDLSMRHQRINDTVTAAQIAALDLLSWKWLFEVIGFILKWTFFGVFILGYLIFRGMKMGVEKLFSKEKPQDV